MCDFNIAKILIEPSFFSISLMTFAANLSKASIMRCDF
jgi:hypothetical protein